MNDWMTVAEISRETGIPEETIRRYINRHALHLQVRKQHKSYMLGNESGSILKQIRKCYSEGMNADQVEDHLAKNTPTIITVNDSGERMTVNVVESLSDIQNAMNDLRKRYEQQEKFNRELLSILQQQAAATSALPDPQQQRRERLNDRLTERRIERKLIDEALILWNKKPESERIRKVGIFRKKEEDITARDRFVSDYVEEHFEIQIREVYGLEEETK